MYNFNIEKMIGEGIDVDEMVKDFTSQVNAYVEKKRQQEEEERLRKIEEEKQKQIANAKFKKEDASYITKMFLEFVSDYYPEIFEEIKDTNNKEHIDEPTGETLISLLDMMKTFGTLKIFADKNGGLKLSSTPFSNLFKF